MSRCRFTDRGHQPVWAQVLEQSMAHQVHAGPHGLTVQGCGDGVQMFSRLLRGDQGDHPGQCFHGGGSKHLVGCWHEVLGAVGGG